MAWRIGAAGRRAVEQAMRIGQEAFSMVIMLGLGLAPVAGAIALSYLLRSWLFAGGLLAAAAFGAAVVWHLRRAPASRPKPPSLPRKSARERGELIAATPVGLTNDLVAFHDFNPERNRFDHW